MLDCRVRMRGGGGGGAAEEQALDCRLGATAGDPAAELRLLEAAHYGGVEPVSRTTQYKKVTKPLLERKRRARINRCLDELKDLMLGALEAEGENISKLEKADILELTVRHLQKLRTFGARDVVEEAQRFQAGFSQCAAEACHFLLSLPELDVHVGRRLIAHLGSCAAAPASLPPSPPPAPSPPPPPPAMWRPW
ncbi:transcription factor HES-2-like [Bacillus rossius redtenbacheri]|uniref:transcription factor HES-2-like n=1 Tax=Bacillus rossius redtenbacheri TaxID=93214 RepID=UPI002FDDC204